MKHYRYRFSINQDAEYKNSPLIRAAFTLAEREHAGHKRGKLEEVEYLCHPIMVYDLLRTRGVDDPASLAAGLLHDTGEMSKRYSHNISLLEHDLVEELQKQGESGLMARTRGSVGTAQPSIYQTFSDR